MFHKACRPRAPCTTHYDEAFESKKYEGLDWNALIIESTGAAVVTVCKTEHEHVDEILAIAEHLEKQLRLSGYTEVNINVLSDD